MYFTFFSGTRSFYSIPTLSFTGVVFKGLLSIWICFGRFETEFNMSEISFWIFLVYEDYFMSGLSFSTYCGLFLAEILF